MLVRSGHPRWSSSGSRCPGPSSAPGSLIRQVDPVRQWKLSPIDLASLDKWDDYTEAKEAMFFYTDTADAPWTVVKSNDKKRARLEAMRHVLTRFQYDDKDPEIVGTPDPLIVGLGHGRVRRGRAPRPDVSLVLRSLRCPSSLTARREPRRDACRLRCTYGHLGRDRLLAEAATAWQQQTRIGDLIAGYGGEEFILLLPASIVAEAVSTMERLRRHPARADLPLRRGHMGRRGDGRRTDRWGDAALPAPHPPEPRRRGCPPRSGSSGCPPTPRAVRTPGHRPPPGSRWCAPGRR